MPEHVQGIKSGQNKASQQQRVTLATPRGFGCSISKSFLEDFLGSFCPDLPSLFLILKIMFLKCRSFGVIYDLFHCQECLSAADLLLVNTWGLLNRKDFSVLPQNCLEAAQLAGRKLRIACSDAGTYWVWRCCTVHAKYLSERTSFCWMALSLNCLIKDTKMNWVAIGMRRNFFLSYILSSSFIEQLSLREPFPSLQKDLHYK